MGSSREEDYLKMTVDKYHIGGIRYNPATADEVYEQKPYSAGEQQNPADYCLQHGERRKRGLCGRYGNRKPDEKSGATRNVQYAYNLGYMSNREAAAIGCNLSLPL